MSGDVNTVAEVIARMQQIQASLPDGDGVGVFNGMYLAVTQHVEAGLTAGMFTDPAFMAQLDVTFAGLWLDAYDAPADAVPKAWAPLFERRRDGQLLPIQFALAGMNTHIEHDLSVAVVQTCRQRGTSPDDGAVRHDYERVNALLAACESDLRRSFLDSVGRAVDDRLGPVVHLIDSWNIDKARDVAWVNAEAMWALRHLGSLAARYERALAGTVGMASRCLLTAVVAR